MKNKDIKEFKLQCSEFRHLLKAINIKIDKRHY